MEACAPPDDRRAGDERKYRKLTDEERITLLLQDAIEIIVSRLQDSDIYQSGEFYEGFRMGAAMILKDIESVIQSIRNLTDHEIIMFDVDAWQKLGRDFKFKLP